IATPERVLAEIRLSRTVLPATPLINTPLPLLPRAEVPAGSVPMTTFAGVAPPCRARTSPLFAAQLGTAKPWTVAAAGVEGQAVDPSTRAVEDDDRGAHEARLAGRVDDHRVDDLGEGGGQRDRLDPRAGDVERDRVRAGVGVGRADRLAE